MTIPTQSSGSRTAGRKPAFEPLPIRVSELELSEPATAIAAGVGRDGKPYGRARVLVRLHGEPLGSIDVPLNGGDVPPEDVLARVVAELPESLDQHLAKDEIARLQTLPVSGLPATECRGGVQLPAQPSLVTVVVTTTGRVDSLARCLDSLLAGDHPNFEVLVVDTHPQLAVVEPLLKQRYDDDARVRLIQEPRPEVSRARNTGLLFARGDVIAFTDETVAVDPAWLRTLAAEFEADPTVACVTGMLLAAELETGAQIFFDTHSGFNEAFGRRVFSISEPEQSPLLPSELGLPGNGANMALRRSLLGDLWGFDVALGQGSLSRAGEDIDSYLDLLFAGHRIVYQPQALAWHWHQDSYGDLLREMRAYGVGLGAVMTKRLLTSRRHRLQLLRQVPQGVRQSAGFDCRPGPWAAEGYPKELARQELIGLVNGPFAYIHSRLHLAWLSA